MNSQPINSIDGKVQLEGNNNQSGIEILDMHDDLITSQYPIQPSKQGANEKFWIDWTILISEKESIRKRNNLVKDLLAYCSDYMKKHDPRSSQKLKLDMFENKKGAHSLRVFGQLNPALVVSGHAPVTPPPPPPPIRGRLVINNNTFEKFNTFQILNGRVLK